MACASRIGLVPTCRVRMMPVAGTRPSKSEPVSRNTSSQCGTMRCRRSRCPSHPWVRILVLDSAVPRTLAGSAYNRRRSECEAALNASCAEARRAHAELATAYEHLVQIAELEQRGELEPGKVASMAEALHQREEAEFGGVAPKPGARS